MQLSSPQTQAFLKRWPRTRPPLSEAHAKSYVDEIKINRGEKGGLLYNVLVWLESWMHKRVSSDRSTAPTLEIGAGTLNHLPYDPGVTHYDVVEPMQALYDESPSKPRVGTFFNNLKDVPLEPRYGRIVSIAAFEHIEDLPCYVARAGLCLLADGTVRVAIPTEGGFLWGFSWRTTTGVAYRLRTGLPYAPLMRHEHINDADEIESLFQMMFEEVKIERFPLPLRHLSFYTFIVASKPRADVCRQVLDLYAET